MRKGMVIETTTEEEEKDVLLRQRKASFVMGIVLTVLAILLIIGTMYGLIRLGVMPFDNTDLFRSV
jgi:heme/copper-type cytochrome/quinol oxidase subunit 4